MPSVSEAEAMVARLGDSVSFYKIGLQLMFAGGLPFAERLGGRASRFSSTSSSSTSTTQSPVRSQSIAAMGMTFVTIHAYPKAMRAAVAARGDARSSFSA